MLNLIQFYSWDLSSLSLRFSEAHPQGEVDGAGDLGEGQVKENSTLCQLCYELLREHGNIYFFLIHLIKLNNYLETHFFILTLLSQRKLISTTS